MKPWRKKNIKKRKKITTMQNPLKNLKKHEDHEEPERTKRTRNNHEEP